MAYVIIILACKHNLITGIYSSSFPCGPSISIILTLMGSGVALKSKRDRALDNILQV